MTTAAPQRFGRLRQLIAATQTIPRKHLYAGLGAMFIASLLDGLGIGLLVPFLRVFLDEKAKFQLPGSWATDLNAWFALQSKEELLTLFAIVLIGSLLFKGVMYYLAQVWTAHYKEHAVEYLREKLYRTYLYAPLSFFNNVQLGKLTSTLQGEVNKVRMLMGHIFIGLTSVMTLGAYLSVLLLVSWQLTLLVATMIGLVILGMNLLLKQIKQYSRVTTELGRELAFKVLNILSGIQIIKSYGTEEYEVSQFRNLTQRQVKAHHDLISKQAWVDPITETTTLTLAMLILISSYLYLIKPGILQISGLLVFMLVLIRISPILRKLNVARASIQEELPFLNKVLESLNLYEKHPLPVGSKTFPGLQANIQLEDVYFAYPGKNPVLRGVDLTIARGTTVAIVGASGAGKSTLTALVPRFYDVTGGAILVDGVDIRTYDVASLRKTIGIVSQETYIFNASLRDNIAYGMSGVSDEAVMEAARLAHAHDFIEQLPRGYQTVVGDRGIQLSGGQRQRISIARAILRNPEILILDEATSALDSESERLVQDALEHLRQNRTVLVIAHRLATVRNADRIIVMEQGRILEDGEHNQLLARRGLYWSYHNLQTLPA
ncbi:ABC transporter ATP-binding protein [Candidatus Cyanaurora vandensis]|uniref:ABC transporter ATP-binding protein n=1 Tax=Candidatus Cyanaurora vandensis TaxID=2714958 RepID=UPI00257BEB44|nr:ABC transporter ATP-binding protein [Candidatus Cyanaurora vandensis]